MKRLPLTVALAAATLAAVLAGSVAAARSDRDALVVVPLHAQQTDVLDAYDQLHAAGLRVELSKPIAISALRVPLAARVTPRPGTRVPRGSVITITPAPGPISSPAVLDSHPHYTVPSFIGRPAETAVAWAQAHAMFWAIPHLQPLPPSSAQHLLTAYRIVGQYPQAGGAIVQGVMVGRGFRPTPLTVTVAPR